MTASATARASRLAVLALAVAAVVAGCGKSPEDFEPTPVPEGERITDAAELAGTRWELTSEEQLLGDDSGYFETCTPVGSARVVTTVLLREDGYYDVEKACESTAVVPDLDSVLGGSSGAEVDDGERLDLTWELDGEGWLRFNPGDEFSCEADGVSETEFQMLCFGAEDTVFERVYSRD